MFAATDRLEFTPPPTRGMLRALALALVAHAFLLAALTWGVHWRNEVVSVSAEAELWSALPQEAAPPPAELPPEPPAPPAPVPVQPPSVDPAIVLAQEKARLKKEEHQRREQLAEQATLKREKLKQEKLLREKKRLQDKLEQEKKAAENKKKEALEAQRLEAQRQANLNRTAGLANATGSPAATGTAQRSSGPSDSYAGRIRARIKPNIVFVETIAGNPMADVEVHTGPDGTIVSRRLIKSSGVKSWDDAVLKAIDKTAVLPRDVDGRVISPLTISFTPKD